MTKYCLLQHLMFHYMDIAKLFNLGEKLYQKAQWDTFIHYRMFQKMYGGCEKQKY
jgi:hypothetical protein